MGQKMVEYVLLGGVFLAGFISGVVWLWALATVVSDTKIEMDNIGRDTPPAAAEGEK